MTRHLLLQLPLTGDAIKTGLSKLGSLNSQSSIEETLQGLRRRLETRSGLETQQGAETEENLVDQLARDRQPRQANRSVGETLQSDRRAVLDCLEALLPQVSSSEQASSTPLRGVSTHVAAQQEWSALMMSAAQEGKVEEIGLVVRLMQVRRPYTAV